MGQSFRFLRITVLEPKRGVSPMVAFKNTKLGSRTYQYEVMHGISFVHANLDALPRPVCVDGSGEIVFLISFLAELPVTPAEIESVSEKNPVIARVYDKRLHRRPQEAEVSLLQTFFSRRRIFLLTMVLRCGDLCAVIPGIVRVACRT